uniref:Granule associated Rac and RHOG effector 1 n=1 Tax=Scleropages formosus TaxID=113540 RepID=A0A8D0CK60_SCLFO
MYCCSAQENKMDYKRRFLLGGSKQKVQQYQMPELGRTLSAPLGSSCSSPTSVAPGGCGHSPPYSGGATTASTVADIQQGISKYLDALNVFCRASAFLTELFSGVFQNSRYSKAAMQLRDVQDNVMEAASRLTAAVKPEIGKMLMELSTSAASFKDQGDLSLQDVEVLGRCFLTVMQVHFQFLSQALQKGQPVAQSCLVEVLAQGVERRGSDQPQGPSPSELEEATRSWRAAAEATVRLRERGRDGHLAGLQVQQLFCSHSTAIPEQQQLKELNMKIDSALQCYKSALEGLGRGEYALKAGFYLDPKSTEASLQGCCSEAEAQQAGRLQTPTQPIQCELPAIPLQIGSRFLKSVSPNESAADNLKQTTLQLIKAEVGQNGMVARDDVPVTDILNQVCPSSWRGACKTAVQLLFGQAGLVVVDTAQIENKEAYAPQISLEESRIVVQVPSTWCLKEDPATMSLLQRSLDPEKTLGLVDVLYTAVFDIGRWKERREQPLPTIQIQLQRESTEYGELAHPSLTSGSKLSGGLPKSISKLTSKFKKSSSASSHGGSSSIPSTPSHSTEDKSKLLPQGTPRMGSLPCTPEPGSPQGPASQLANGYTPDDKGMNLPTDQEMQDVIDFLSGFNMGKSQQASPLVRRRNSMASSNMAESKALGGGPPSTPTVSHGSLQPPAQALQQPPIHPGQRQHQQPSQQALQYYQHLVQPIGQQPLPQQQQQQQQRGPSKWAAPQVPTAGFSSMGHQGQWGAPGLPDLSSELYSLGLVSSYMDGVVSEMLGQKCQGPRNNTWPNREQSEGSFTALGDTVPFDPVVGTDPEFARYVAGVSQAMLQKRQAQHVRRPSNAHSSWPVSDEAHRSWTHADYYAERDAVSSWPASQADSASSSDETSSANGDSLFSMFSGPDLVAAVKQRRKHSCGEQEVSTLPSLPLHHSNDDNNQDSKMKTWPPKAPWQHSSLHTNTLPNPSSSLYPVGISSSQWNDSMQMLQSPVWSTASSCSASSGFPFGQQQSQQPSQQATQHKALNKGFKSFPLKHEHRPSYLHQY